MAYVIKRNYGKGHDYLYAWCDQWGTACIGSIKMAMQFETKELADAAALKAQTECKGINGPAVGIVFSSLKI